MKLEAMKRQGKRVVLEENETSRPLDGKLESAERKTKLQTKSEK